MLTLPQGSSLANQIHLKNHCLGSYLNLTKSGVLGIKKSKRLLTLSQNDRTIKITKYECESIRDFDIYDSKNLDSKYCVKFNSLSKHNDLGGRDQAIKTLHNIFDESRGFFKYLRLLEKRKRF